LSTAINANYSLPTSLDADLFPLPPLCAVIHGSDVTQIDAERRTKEIRRGKIIALMLFFSYVRHNWLGIVAKKNIERKTIYMEIFGVPLMAGGSDCDKS
jgi:hypothetical protein